MRKLVLVTAIVLASSAAHAGASRGLITLASTDRGTSVEQTAPVEPAPASTAQTASVKSAEVTPADTPDQRAEERAKPKARYESDRQWVERRIRRELARYGIY
jgi:hypothetical protein